MTLIYVNFVCLMFMLLSLFLKSKTTKTQDEAIVHATLTVGVNVSVNWLVYTTT